MLDQRTTQRQIKLRIPQQYHQEPVISRLVSEYKLTVNISAAILGINGLGDGWFDLELRGKVNDIDHALIYLHESNFEIWDDLTNDQTGW